MNVEQARAKFKELRDQESGVSTEDLEDVWDALETVAVDEIIGQWKGDDFATGHFLHDHLVASRWYGKTFESVADAKPLVCRGEDGVLFSNKDLGKGEASLWMVEFRGEVTATMVYDGQPIFDHFKKVDDSTLLGVMNGKDGTVPLDHNGKHYYFLLERA